MNRTLLIALILITFNKVYAQVPIITSVSPEKGGIGFPITIRGFNFEANFSDNVVYVGPEKASIMNGNTNEIVVLSANSSYKQISVTANGLTAYSTRAYMPLYLSPPINAGSFKVKTNIANVGVNAIAVKDFDNDGKADIASVGNGNSLTIFKNTSTVGAPSFLVAISKTGLEGTGIAIDDLNGDGKPDIVTTNFMEHKISVFINTGINGQINFANALTFSTGQNPYHVAITDCNHDGKPDIIVTNESYLSKSVSVFQNITPAGGTIALNPAKNFATELDARGISVGDLDLDGNVDLIVTCQSGSLNLFRNISTINNIDFSPALNVSLPAGSSPESAVIADFDGDLKLDIAVANNYSSNVSVFKNISSPGSFSFSPRQDYATGQWNFSSTVSDFDVDGKPDILVTNQGDNSVSVLMNNSTTNTISFAGKLDFPIGNWPRASAAADVDGDFRPDIIIGNNGAGTITVLLNTIAKTQAVINFPTPVVPQIGPGNILITNATSNNNETPIVYTSSNPSVAYVRADGQIEVIAPGTTVITANQPETAGFLAAAPVNRTYLIKQVQTINFPPLPAKLVCDADFSVNTTSNTLQPLFYSSSNTAVATISATGVIHIAGTGTTTITVTQPGSALYIDAVPKSQVLTVTAPVPPTVTIAADNNSVCNGWAAVFTATTLNAGLNPVYQWIVNGSPQGTNNNKLTVNNIQATDVVQCRVTQGGSCSASALSNSLSVSVQPMLTPGVSIQMANGTFCEGANISFTATPVNEGSQPKYEWLVNNILVGTTSVPQFSYSGFNNGDKISCTLSNTTSPCLAIPSATSNSVVVNIATPPNAQLSISTPSTKVYGATDVKFSVTSSLTVSVYQWQINNVNYGSNQPYFITNILKSGDRVKCIVTVNAPCAVPKATDEIVMDVTLPADIKIPNTFTPNGDGINDVWTIPELSFFPNCIVNIFDRNGSLIFFSRGYSNAWDGSVNGKKLPTGTYYYVIKTDGAKGLQRNGYITILH
ncbi:FG-GAP-like repeat-containing protein [Mucilaginibacter auburnensis]|uniref:Gliding motility-associated-like protein n=1 Tax=Mucilaginibacter auburnensis TaxID=1457233 RepID=A0A2H9VRN4_9SPHI|nr:FG-GAP-like repeat-containing protein [Mucilaginibacter auburnensis]PJJ83486.1 gliding motility-associated-like protein [Mucilaginibacter auburnensis]